MVKRLSMRCLMLVIITMLCPFAIASASYVERYQMNTAVVFNLSKPLSAYQFNHPFMVRLSKELPVQPDKGVSILSIHQIKPKAKLELMPLLKSTNAFNALQEANELLQKKGGVKILWFITDQNVFQIKDPILLNSQSKKMMGKLLNQLLSGKVTFNALALKPFQESNLLLSIANKTNGKFELDGKHNIRQTIPLQNNQFVVDKALDEIIVLFQAKDNVQLKMPQGNLLSKKTNNKQIYWKRNNNLHTILIKKPQEGIWSILGEVNEPRVEYISKLVLNAETLDQNIFLGEINTLTAFLEENKARIVDPDFINNMKVYVTVKNEALDETYKINLNDKGAGVDDLAQDGIFSGDFAVLAMPGVYDITLYANAIGIKRKHHQKVFVHNYPVNLIPDYDLETNKLIIKARLNTPLLAANEIEISMRQRPPDGKIKSLAFEKSKDGNWTVETNLVNVYDIEQLSFHVNARTQGGRFVNILLPELDVNEVYMRAKQKAQDKLLAQLKADNPWIGELLLFSNERRKDQILTDLIQKHPKSRTHWQPKYTSFKQEMLKTVQIKIAQEEALLNQGNALESLAQNHSGVDVIIDAKQKMPQTAEPNVKEAKTKDKTVKQEPTEIKANSNNWLIIGLGLFSVLLIMATAIVLFFYLRSRKSADQREEIAEQTTSDTSDTKEDPIEKSASEEPETEESLPKESMAQQPSQNETGKQQGLEG